MSLVIAILMKDPTSAKTRLSSTLNRSQRERLALIMFENTIAFFRGFLPGTVLAVVTPSERIAAIGRSAGAIVVDDDGGGDINQAARAASEWAISAGATALLVVHADIPILRQREFDLLLDASEDRGVVIAEALDGGTNAILLSPPDAIDFAFGPQSAARHEDLAHEQKLTVRKLSPFFLSRDVDRPSDLRICHRILAWKGHGAARLTT